MRRIRRVKAEAATFDRIRQALVQPGEASSDFDLNGPQMAGAVSLRPAGVLVPLIEVDGEIRVILTKRASHLKHHPGQIAFPGGKQEDSDADVIEAPMPGLVKVLLAKPGQEVKEGDRLAVLEAMKMEHSLLAARDGVVAEVLVEEGAQVTAGAALVRLEEAEA